MNHPIFSPRKKRFARLLTLGLLALGSTGVAMAQTPERFKELEPFLDSETVLVAVFQPAKFDFAQFQKFEELMGVPSIDQDPLLAKILTELGIDRVYVIAEFPQLLEGSTTLAFPSSSSDDKLIDALKKIVPPGLVFEKESGFVLVSNSPTSIDCILEKQEAPSKNLLQGLGQLKGTDGAVIAVADDQSSLKMAVDLAKTTLPDEYTKNIVDSLKSMRYAVIDGKITSPIAIQCTLGNSADANRLQSAIQSWLASKKASSSLLKLTVHGESVQTEIKSPEDFVRLNEAITGTKARDMVNANNLKQIGLAFHNFYSAYNRLPPQALSNSDGKKLLSWRVMILPFIDQVELYQQFHLDEPWDSEHNIKLVDKMPAVFGTPAKGQKPGTTRYVAPLSANSIFGKPGKANGFADITDGTSNTIFVVEALPGNAVVWTKPEDLVIDSKEPMKGIIDDTLEYSRAVFADGSVHQLKRTLKPSTLLKLIGMNDGEVIDPNELD